jgi:hypothetical protein
MSTPTIIPAQPGYYIAEPTFSDDTDEVNGIALTPIIAWLLKYQPAADDDWEGVTVEPIEMGGWTNDDEPRLRLIKHPDGRFTSQFGYAHQATERLAMEHFKVMHRLRLKREAKREAANVTS